MQMTSAVSFLFLLLITMSCKGIARTLYHRIESFENGARSFEFGADRTRQRETKAEILAKVNIVIGGTGGGQRWTETKEGTHNRENREEA